MTNRLEVGLRRLDRHTGFEPCHSLQPAEAPRLEAIAAGQDLRLHHDRHPHIERNPDHRSLECRRHDPDDRQGVTVDRDRPAHDRRIAGVTTMPQAVADHHDGTAIGHAVVVGTEGASERRRNTDDGEVVARYQRAVKPLGALGLAHRAKAERCRLRDDKAVQGPGAVAIIAVIGIGQVDVAAITGPGRDRDEVALVCDAGQRVEQHRLHPAEDDGVGADSEAQRHDRRGGQPAVLDEHPDGIAQVVHIFPNPNLPAVSGIPTAVLRGVAARAVRSPRHRQRQSIQRARARLHHRRRCQSPHRAA